MSDERVELLAEALADELHIDEAHGYPPGFTPLELAEVIAATPAFARLLELDEDRLADALYNVYTTESADDDGKLRAPEIATEYRRLAAHKEEARP